jgi:ElaB/YqjD/DUF883 family membrane-anchored ribosome-binding protein
MNDMTTVHKEKLLSDLKIVVADADELVKMTAGQVGRDAGDVAIRMQNQMNRVKDGMTHMQEVAVTKAKALGQSTDGYVHENPWKAIGIAGGLGVVIGLLAGRR